MFRTFQAYYKYLDARKCQPKMRDMHTIISRSYIPPPARANNLSCTLCLALPCSRSLSPPASLAPFAFLTHIHLQQVHPVKFEAATALSSSSSAAENETTLGRGIAIGHDGIVRGSVKDK